MNSGNIKRQRTDIVSPESDFITYASYRVTLSRQSHMIQAISGPCYLAVKVRSVNVFLISYIMISEWLPNTDSMEVQERI